MVVAVGETLVEPFSTGVSAPMPWSTEKEVACVVVQESFAASPPCTVLGFAVSVQEGAGGGGKTTVTVV
ncbi:MAG: hypothetical protein B7X04_04415 [Parcubacteria group bacterium 21-54-25]|nr:MAG: hypothetical protein B7X04_04415 [Parcubacteria group bacterium 21-54-25]